MVILPMVATVAADEPDTAAKIAQPITLVWSRRPGMRFNQGARPLNKSCDKRVRKRISPIHRNRGRAVSVQLEAAPQMVMAMASPAERAEKTSMPSHAAPAKVRPTQTPHARKPMIEITSMVITKISFMQRCFLCGFVGSAAKAVNGFVQHGNEENNGTNGHGQLGNPQRCRVLA